MVLAKVTIEFTIRGDDEDDIDTVMQRPIKIIQRMGEELAEKHRLLGGNIMINMKTFGCKNEDEDEDETEEKDSQNCR